MSAPLGNDYWKSRIKHGPTPRFETEEELAAACVQYFTWCEEHPLKEQKPMRVGDNIKMVRIDKLRVPTIQGLCGHLGIRRGTWNDWRKDRDDLAEVIERVDVAIEQAQLEGGLSGLANANLISRLVGLVDKQAHQHKGFLGTAQLSDKSTPELVDRIKEILSGH